MTTAALILAGGRGSRAGGDRAKQWQMLAGRPLLQHAIDTFSALPEIDSIALVLPEGDDDRRADYAARGFLLATAGEDRAGSVRNGLAALAHLAPDWVLIHDGARPCIATPTIRAVLTALESGPAAAPGLGVTDALWTGENASVTGTRNRDGLFAAQTPQGFHYNAIRAAHAAHPGGASDDVAVARAHGLPVAITPGDADNIKVTLAADFARAERILESRVMARKTASPLPMRLGNGFDVHRFGDGRHVTLCGVEVPHDRGLQGHSDADVGMHAITDAIYGALAEGDIGRHFPPSDPQWRGVASDIFLRHACDLAASKGYGVGNVDCTLICEHPKVGPHASAMQARLAQIMGIEPSAVSVKATTSEQLGFTGRGEGIAASATALLVRT